MFYNNIDPVFFSIGPFDVRYYGLVYGIGFLCSYLALRYFISKDEDTPLEKKDADDIILYILLGSIVGARIFYSFVYNIEGIMRNPFDIFIMWRGGMSFHGGLLGGFLAVVLYVFRYNKKVKKEKDRISVYHITDLVSFSLAFSIMLGRLGNFANNELYGRITNVPWAVKFKTAEGFRHPSQIYEAIYSATIGFVLLWLNQKKMPRGFLTWTFFVLYGTFRFITEFFRQPDPQMGASGFYFGWITMGQILGVLMIVAGGYMLYRIYTKESKKYE